jgi:uncharacterized membrane protein
MDGSIGRSRWFHPLLLLGWLILGSGFRWLRLGMEPPWTDEFATLVYSLGNSFLEVPLDRAISGEMLLQPVRVASKTGIGDVVAHLLAESTHPPVYFMLSHWWLGWFSSQGELVSVTAARSLAAGFGVVAIAAIFFLVRSMFRSTVGAHLAAAVMAVSPFGIFLSREARHYTLAILVAIASVGIFLVALRHLHQRQRLPLLYVLAWVATNGLGVAVHYFFTLVLAAQAIALGLLSLRSWQQQRTSPSPSELPPLTQSVWYPIYAAAAGSLATTLAWLPLWQSFAGSRLTGWVSHGYSLSLEPVLRLLLWLVTMFALLPVDPATLPIPVVVVAGIVLLVFVLWALWQLYRGIRLLLHASNQQWQPVRWLLAYLLAAAICFAILTYGFQKDVTLAPRFAFIFFPAAIAAIGMSLAAWWHKGKYSIALAFLIAGCLGSATTVGDWGYLQHHRTRLLAQAIQQHSQAPILIASTHKHHGQTGRLMGLAWTFRQQPFSSSPIFQQRSPQFLLAHKAQPLEAGNDPAVVLQETVAQLSPPLDVWAIDFHAPVVLEERGCVEDEQRWPELSSYRVRLYHCPHVASKGTSKEAL